ncbi:MAG: amidohydrolase family protein [Gemmatimonadota bacterium]|nr:amidohydrolase family protein [Gemmatimonadota bacterium]
MKRVLSLAVGFVILGTACGRAETPQEDGSSGVAIRGVTVLSPVDGTQSSGQTVLIDDGRIVEVRPDADADLAADAAIVEADGLFLMPGLWDFHAHLAMADLNAAPLMVTQGVTGARDLGAIFEEIDALRDRILAEEVLGPRIVRVGPTLNGAPNGPHHRVIDTPEAARAAVTDLEQAGADLLKTHNATEREPYFALLEAASEAGLDVAGHVPTGVEPIEACEAGQASIDHIVTIFEGTYMAGFASEMEAFQGMEAWLETEAPVLVECFARQGTLFVPTLRTYEYRAHRAALYDDPPEGWDYLTAESRASFRETNVPAATDRNPLVIRLRESLVDVGKVLVGLLYEAGAPIGTGTDFAGPGVVPGFGIHRELELLVEGGMPEHAAIWASARGPGERAGADPLTGRIEAGAPADLVLLRSNPFERIDAVSEIEAVVLRGRILDRGELDRILAELAAR